MIRSGDDRQELYNAVKNDILSYKKVNSKISWGHEFFKLGRIKIAQMKVKGKTLCVYLPLDPDKYDANRLFFKDIRKEGKEVDFPMMMKVKSDRAVKYVAELIADVMANNGINKVDNYAYVDYKLPNMSVEEMLVSDPVLAKLVEDNSSPVVVSTTKPVVEEFAPVEESVEEDIVVKDGIRYRYNYSYSARMIRSGEERQELYNVIKNNILSYKKVNSKISWGHELFKLGRIKIAQLKVKGKTLCVYLPLDPSKYDQGRLYFKETGKDEFPMMMKVKSDRAVKYVAELISDVMANNNIVKLDNYQDADYKLPYMSVEEMLISDPVLVKLIKDNSNPVDFKTSALVEETPIVEEKVEEETPVISDDEEVVVKDGVTYKYKFSYSARLIRSGEDRQELYNIIKNNILSYKKVNSKISWGHELFKLGRIKIAQLKVKGKTLCVYLPLNPDKYDANRLFFKDVRKEGKDVEFPMMMKVKSDRACKYVAELIEDVMAENNIVKLDNYVEQDYRLANLSIEEMLTSNPALVKLTQDNLDTVTTKPVKEAILEETKQTIEEESSKEDDLNTTVDESSNVETKTSVKQRKFFFARLRMVFRNRRAKNK